MLLQKTKCQTALMIVSFSVLFSGCTTVKTSTQSTADQKADEVSAMTVKGKTKKNDYLGESVVLAAFYAEDGGFSETRYYPAEIITSASDETKGEYQVVTHVGDFDVATGDKNWTDKVILESHPADKEELKEGMIVLYTNKPKEEGLEVARWHRGVVASTDELYKNMVQIDHVWHLDRSDESDSKKDVPVERIRIIDKPDI